MNDIERITALVDKFPRLFHGESPQIPSHLPRGWEGLVTRLMTDLNVMLDDSQAECFRFLQIKEKVAGLRVYWRLDSEEKTVAVDRPGGQSAQGVDTEPDESTTVAGRIAARVLQAEEEAAQTCQRCSQTGASNQPSLGGVATLCAACCQQRAEAP